MLSHSQDGGAVFQGLGVSAGEVSLPVSVVDVVGLLLDQVHWVSPVHEPLGEFNARSRVYARGGGSSERPDELSPQHTRLDADVVGRSKVEVRVWVYGFGIRLDVQSSKGFKSGALEDGYIQEIHLSVRLFCRVLDRCHSLVAVGDQLLHLQFGGFHQDQDVIYKSEPDQWLSALP